MSDYNHVGIIGRLTRDAEIKYTANGTAVCNFSIACNKSIPPKNEGDKWENEVSYFDITLWGKKAEGKAKYLTKGEQVLVEGELKQDRWEQDGQARSKVKITAVNIQLLGGKEDWKGDGTPPRQADIPRATSHPEKASDEFEDDIPF